MTNNLDSALEQALQQCAAEPIHQLGAIQSHGVALVLNSSSDYNIIQASANLATLLGISADLALNQSLQAVLGETAAQQVQLLIATAHQSSTNTAIGIIDVANLALNKLDVHVFFSDGFPVLELCDDSCLDKPEDISSLLLKKQILLLEADNEENFVEYLQKIACLIREIMAYDNVMIYRFDENWDGQVIAQSRCDAATDYLGAHFPASDIPPQARALYTHNLVRVLTDVDAPTVAFIPTLNPHTNVPLDLSSSSLRSLSPIHLKYLRNMGTAATMTISLLQNGKLWGLIACHHLTPKRISVALRETAYLISKMIASKLVMLELAKKHSLTNKFLDINVQIVSLLSKLSKNMYKDLLPELMSLLNATGIIVVVDGERFMSGITPTQRDTTDLLAWLNHHINEGTIVSSQLSSEFVDSALYQDKVSGLLAIRPVNTMQNCIVWLRQEKLRTVNWAGAYAQGLTQSEDGQYQLTPRQSFETWSETWRGRAEPWSEDEINLAQLFKKSITDFQKTHQLINEFTEAQQTQVDLINLIPNGIVITDPQRRITFVNKDFEGFTGYQLQEVLGKYCSILQGQDTDPAQIQVIRKALNEQKVFFGEILNYRKNGASYWSELTISPIFNCQNQLSQFVGVMRDITDKKLQQDALAHSEQRFRGLSDVAPTLIWQADIHKNRFWFNKGWLTFTGRSIEDEQGQGWMQGIHPEDLEQFKNTYFEAFDQQIEFCVEYRLRRHDGEYRWIDGHGVPQYSVNGDFEGYVGTCADITNVRNSKAATDFFKVAHEMIYTTDLNCIILDCNERFCEITGYSREEALGKNVRMLKSGLHDSHFYAQMWQDILIKGFWRGELINQTKKGDLSTLITTISVVPDSHGRPHRYLAVASDISILTKKKQQLEHLAYYDNLTGLANRTLLMDRLKQAMSRIKRHAGLVAVLFIDLDGFKAINDHYGHDVGDEFLIAISQNMRVAIRDSDTLARLGGDEFVIILDDLKSTDDLNVVIPAISKVCRTEVLLKGLRLKVSASIGCSVYPIDTESLSADAETILNQADQAMYVAKRQGKNTYHYFDKDQDNITLTRNTSIAAIQLGLSNNEFELYYQPKVNMRSGEVLGFEVLIRWNKNHSELLEPMTFLPLVQNNPVGIELGWWVVKTALAQLAQWHELGLQITLSVNVDARQLTQSNFVEHLKAEMDKHPYLKPDGLELEILETIELNDRNDVIKVINDCRALGVEFALDDFGTGYSSITYLKELPIRTLKIDRSFIAEITHSNLDVKLIANITHLANDMGKQVVAEGVETIEQGELLIKLGCELGQGYAIAKPMSADQVLKWLTDWQPYPSWLMAARSDRT